MIARCAAGIAALVLFVATFGGGIAVVIVIGRTAWAWLFVVVPGLVVVTIILARVGIRLMSRALDG